MKSPNTAPRNNTNNVTKEMYIVSTNLYCIPFGISTNKNTKEKILMVNAILNKNSINLVSISYVDTIL